MKKIVSLLLVAIMALGAVSALAYEYQPHKGDLGGVQAALIEAAINHDGSRTGAPIPDLAWERAGAARKLEYDFDYINYMALWLYYKTDNELPGGAGTWKADGVKWADFVEYFKEHYGTDFNYYDVVSLFEDMFNVSSGDSLLGGSFNFT